MDVLNGLVAKTLHVLYVVLLATLLRFKNKPNQETKVTPEGQTHRQEKTGRPASPGEAGGPNDWKALAPTALDSVAVSMVRWGAAGGVLGAIGRDMLVGAHVLAETVLHRQLRYCFACGRVTIIVVHAGTAIARIRVNRGAWLYSGYMTYSA